MRPIFLLPTISHRPGYACPPAAGELLQWASEEPERYLIEDDYDSEFRFTGRRYPLCRASTRGGKVITINTFPRA